MPDPPKHFAIREATVADAPALARSRLALFRDLGQEPSADAAAEFERVCEETFERFISSGTNIAWLAEVPGETDPVGVLVLLKFPRLPTLKNSGITEGYIVNVFVIPAWRHRGIASSLTQTAVDYSRRSGLARIRLHATSAGYPVYSQSGFRNRTDEMELDFSQSNKPDQG